MTNATTTDETRDTLAQQLTDLLNTAADHDVFLIALDDSGGVIERPELQLGRRPAPGAARDWTAVRWAWPTGPWNVSEPADDNDDA